MKLKRIDNKDGFFLELIYSKLYDKFYDDYTKKIPHKNINRLMAVWFNLNKQQTRLVLKMLEMENYVSIEKNAGNGNYWIIIKQRENKNEK